MFKSARPSSYRLSKRLENFREVLECASVLALFGDSRESQKKRQDTGALQNLAEYGTDRPHYNADSRTTMPGNRHVIRKHDRDTLPAMDRNEKIELILIQYRWLCLNRGLVLFALFCNFGKHFRVG